MSRLLEFTLSSAVTLLAVQCALSADVVPVIKPPEPFFELVRAKRPVDPNWDKRGLAVQQYELRVQRLDTRFDERLMQIYESAMTAGKWKGTSAVHDRISYWAAGVTAYFDAAGQNAAPNDAAHPIALRENLKEYDSDLYQLVNETMAYDGHVDWRSPRN